MVQYIHIWLNIYIIRNIMLSYRKCDVESRTRYREALSCGQWMRILTECYLSE